MRKAERAMPAGSAASGCDQYGEVTGLPHSSISQYTLSNWLPPHIRQSLLKLASQASCDKLRYP